MTSYFLIVLSSVFLGVATMISGALFYMYNEIKKSREQFAVDQEKKRVTSIKDLRTRLASESLSQLVSDSNRNDPESK